MSSFVNWGYSAMISSIVIPLARKSRIRDTQIHVPRMHGLPKQTFGSTTIRWRSEFIVYLLTHFSAVLLPTKTMAADGAAVGEICCSLLPLHVTRQTQHVQRALDDDFDLAVYDVRRSLMSPCMLSALENSEISCERERTTDKGNTR